MNQPPINHHARNHQPLQAYTASTNGSTNNYNRTERAGNNNIISWLDSLPIYDSSSWEGLHRRYGHNAHVSARVPSIIKQSHRGMTPRFYIPPSNWWRNQARNNMHEAFVRKITSFDDLIGISNYHMEKNAWAFEDIFIPNIRKPYLVTQ